MNHISAVAEKYNYKQYNLFKMLLLFTTVFINMNRVFVSQRGTELDLYSDHFPEHHDIIPLFHTLVI